MWVNKGTIGGTGSGGGDPIVVTKAPFDKGIVAFPAGTVLDTSGITNMYAFFNGYSSLTTAPALDTSNATNMERFFFGCSSLTTAPALDLSNVTNMNYFFSGCSSLTTAPALDLSNVTSMNYSFYGCSSLTTVPALELSNVTSMNRSFDGCSALQSVTLPGLKISVDLSGCKLNESALNALFTSLGTANPGATITITGNPGAATCDRTIATSKGWTVTG